MESITKIPIRIYLLPYEYNINYYLPEEYQSNIKLLNDITSEEYYSSYKLINLSEKDIYNGYITITKENVPQQFISIFESYETEKLKLKVNYYKNNFYVILKNNKSTNNEFVRLYIPKDKSIIQNFSDYEMAFEFYINPQDIDISERKLVTEIKTRDGYLIEQWGPSLGEIRVTTISGRLYDIDKLKNNKKPGLEDILKSRAMNNFLDIYDLYNFYNTGIIETSRFFLMKILNISYIGYFVDFNGPKYFADRPYILQYSFTFRYVKKYYLRLNINNNTG